MNRLLLLALAVPLSCLAFLSLLALLGVMTLGAVVHVVGGAPAAMNQRTAPPGEMRQRGTALHSITSSARASTVVGMSILSDFAVLRLTTMWNFVGSVTGRSAGFSPLTIRPTYVAACR